jgi:hypothetical protein
MTPSSEPLGPRERRRLLAMRPWSRAERAVVLRGLWGRVAIAAEPAVLAFLFAVLTIGMLRMASDPTGTHAGLQLFAPVFGLGAVGFATYAVLLLRAPLRALRETYQPIFIVDGYIRTRGRDDLSPRGQNGYVAVLLDDRRIACEWPSLGVGDLPAQTIPALVEFSEFGGIHTIDGRATGILPPTFANIGVGSNRPPGARRTP